MWKTSSIPFLLTALAIGTLLSQPASARFGPCDVICSDCPPSSRCECADPEFGLTHTTTCGEAPTACNTGRPLESSVGVNSLATFLQPQESAAQDVDVSVTDDSRVFREAPTWTMDSFSEDDAKEDEHETIRQKDLSFVSPPSESAPLARLRRPGGALDETALDAAGSSRNQ